MGEHPPGEDPGWGIDARTIVGMLVPGFGVRRAAGATNVLVAVRRLFVSFAVALVMVGIVGIIVSTGAEEDVDPALAAVGAFALGTAGVAASRRMARNLPCEDVGQLIGGYRTRFFLRIAFADGALLLGFVGGLFSGSAWPVAAGAIPAAIGFVLLAPSRANLQREDEALRLRGCPHSLYGSLLDAATG